MRDEPTSESRLSVYAAFGLAIGAGLGTTLGAVFGNVALGVVFGPVIGLGVAVAAWFVISGKGSEGGV